MVIPFNRQERVHLLLKENPQIQFKQNNYSGLRTVRSRAQDIRVIAQMTQLKQFSNECRNINTKVNTPTNHKRSKQRDQPIKFPVVACDLILKAWEKVRVHGAIGSCFASY